MKKTASSRGRKSMFKKDEIVRNITNTEYNHQLGVVVPPIGKFPRTRVRIPAPGIWSCTVIVPSSRIMHRTWHIQ